MGLWVLGHPPTRGDHEVYNIGNAKPEGLLERSTLDRALGRDAEKIFRPIQPGDFSATYADVLKLRVLNGYDQRSFLLMAFLGSSSCG